MCTCVERLISRRPYRPPLTRHAAISYLVRQASEGLVDSDAVMALLAVQSLYPLGSDVRLSDGTIARVLRRNGNNYSVPIVKRPPDQHGMLLDPSDSRQIVNLAEAGLTIIEVIGSSEAQPVSTDKEILPSTNNSH